MLHADPTTVTMEDIQTHINSIQLGAAATLPRMGERQRSVEEKNELQSFFAQVKFTGKAMVSLPERKMNLMTEPEMVIWDHLVGLSRLVIIRQHKQSRPTLAVTICLLDTEFAATPEAEFKKLVFDSTAPLTNDQGVLITGIAPHKPRQGIQAGHAAERSSDYILYIRDDEGRANLLANGLRIQDRVTIQCVVPNAKKKSNVKVCRQ